MTGTFITITAIIVGGLHGVFFEKRLSEKIKNSLMKVVLWSN